MICLSLLSAGSAFASLTQSFVDLGTLSSSVLTVSHSVTVAEGDVIVMVAGSNKKDSVQSISFSSAAGTFVNLDAHTLIGGDPNPNSFLSYLTVEAAGTYAFAASYPGGGITANIGLYHLKTKAMEFDLGGTEFHRERIAQELEAKTPLFLSV